MVIDAPTCGMQELPGLMMLRLLKHLILMLTMAALGATS